MNGKRSEKKTNNKHANQSSGTAVRGFSDTKCCYHLIIQAGGLGGRGGSPRI